MSKQMANGRAYEDKIYSSCKQLIEQGELPNIRLGPKDNANNANGVDLPLIFLETPLSVEAKLEGAQMSGTSLHYSRDSGEFTMVKPSGDSAIILEAAKTQSPFLNAYIDALRKEEPLGFHETISGFPLCATTAARSRLKAMGLQRDCAKEFRHPIAFMKEFHRNKGVNYIQIQKLGFFHLGINPFNLPIPELEGEFNIECRIGYAGGKIKVPQDERLSARPAGFRIQGRLITSNKSPYTLDNPEHIKLLFGTPPESVPPSAQ
jgi:hypothetical protein